jgi:hypothetical protein
MVISIVPKSLLTRRTESCFKNTLAFNADIHT